MCLPMMWKILRAQIREIFSKLYAMGCFWNNKKNAIWRTRGTGNLMYIDQHILNESKERQKNIAMAWIDYKKAYDIQQSHKIQHKSHEKLKVVSIGGGKTLATMKIQRDIFQGDAFSSLLFVITILPLNYIFRKRTEGYKFTKSQEKINPLTYMNNIKCVCKK